MELCTSCQASSIDYFTFARNDKGQQLLVKICARCNGVRKIAFNFDTNKLVRIVGKEVSL